MRLHSGNLALLSLCTTLAVSAAACVDSLGPIPGSQPSALPAAVVTTDPPPAPLVDIAVAGGTLRTWPFNGTSFDGAPNNPVNLVLTGDANPVALRATLLSLDGNRTAFGFPAAPPFDCTWKDAFGGIETAWSAPGGWTSNPIQLECGAYGPIRFHIRIFPAGAHAVANAHFEILIPGTTEHQVISWELAEQLVVADFVRSGLLGAAPASTAAIHPAPGFREIPAVIYNGMPDALKGAIGGPLGNVSDPVPIGTDGRATVLTLAQNAPVVAGSAAESFTIPFDQVIPRPFCNAGNEFVHVGGSVDFSNRVEVEASGEYRMVQTASGNLAITPIDPQTGQPLAPTYGAVVSNEHESTLNGGGIVVHALVKREELAPGTASLQTQLAVTPGGSAKYRIRERC